MSQTTAKPPVSYAPEVFVEGRWSCNGLRFATLEEAEASALNLMTRWTLVRDARAVETTDPVNYTWVDGQLQALQQAVEMVPQPAQQPPPCC
jgi:hypothetical protein